MASKFLSPAYEVMLSAASPGINFLRGIAGYQDPIGTPAMQDRMLELEAQKGPSGSIGYEDYGLPVSSEGGRFTGGLPSLLLSNPIDFGLAGSVGRYGYSPEGRTDLKYDFTPDEETGSTGNAILDFINRGGIKNYISESKGLPFALPDLSLGAPTFNFNRNKTTQPDFTNAPRDDYASLYSSPELDTSRFADVDLESGYLDRAGSSDQDVYSEKPKSFRDSKTLEEYFQNRSPLQGILQYLPTPFNIVRNILSGEGIRSLNQRLRNTDFGQSRTLQEYLQRREARKDAERLQTVGQQLQQASERGGGYQPTSREQNVARTESRRADKGLGQGGVYGL